MSMEIEHEVKVEPGDIFFEAGHTTFLAAATEMPHFTEEALRAGLGDEYIDHVDRLFKTAIDRVAS